MAPKKRKKIKKPDPEKAAPALPPPPTPARPGKACICIENNEGWFCMQQLPNGELKECDGPFDTKEECERHVCK